MSSMKNSPQNSWIGVFFCVLATVFTERNLTHFHIMGVQYFSQESSNYLLETLCETQLKLFEGILKIGSKSYFQKLLGAVGLVQQLIKEGVKSSTSFAGAQHKTTQTETKQHCPDMSLALITRTSVHIIPNSTNIPGRTRLEGKGRCNLQQPRKLKNIVNFKQNSSSVQKPKLNEKIIVITDDMELSWLHESGNSWVSQ